MAEIETKELTRCPFCEGKARWSFGAHKYDPSKYGWQIGCGDCGFETPSNESEFTVQAIWEKLCSLMKGSINEIDMEGEIYDHCDEQE